MFFGISLHFENVCQQSWTLGTACFFINKETHAQRSLGRAEMDQRSCVRPVLRLSFSLIVHHAVTWRFNLVCDISNPKIIGTGDGGKKGRKNILDLGPLSCWLPKCHDFGLKNAWGDFTSLSSHILNFECNVYIGLLVLAGDAIVNLTLESQV